MKGISEMRTIFAYLSAIELNTEVELDLTLARGLNYYTGAIFEVKAKDYTIGSICGGGRYDDLTGIFGLKDVSGVGVSFGADRIFDVLSGLEQFPSSAQATTDLLFVNFGAKEEAYIMPILQKLRKAGINTELFPESDKMKKQMTYADKKSIPFVAIVGENEMTQGTISLKNMISGEQNTMNLEELIVFFKENKK
jgi:histidyl-tRNA synthetase